MPKLHTLADIEAMRDKLSSETKETLGKLYRDELRRYAAYFADVKYNDKKEVLIDKILEGTKEVRLQKQKAILDLQDEVTRTINSTDTISVEWLEKLTSVMDAKVAANIVNQKLRAKNPITNTPVYAASTIAKTQVPDIKKLVSTLKDVEYSETFSKQLGSLVSDLHKEYNRHYTTEQLSEYASDRTIVNFRDVISWCEKQLIELKSWKLVTIALTLTSGRRPVELHTTGKFHEIDFQSIDIKTTETRGHKKVVVTRHLDGYEIIKGWLSFEGQAKEKKDMKYKESVGVYNIPLLVDTSLWLSGFNYLENEEKLGFNEDGTPKVDKTKLNGTYAKYISDVIKSANLTEKLGISKWYDCRDFYAASFRDYHNKLQQTSDNHRQMHESKILARLLGHNPDDVTTQDSYNKIAVRFE
uniref:Telomere resolvase ResT/TelK catalytic domain-containing protein n=1 Tax=Tolypothrix bouteillei VB521301 TaxID=1479485 RepID=A0A0C1NLW6_9CYAN